MCNNGNGDKHKPPSNFQTLLIGWFLFLAILFYNCRKMARIANRSGKPSWGLPEPPKSVDLTKVLMQARASGVLNCSNRGIGPMLPEEVAHLHESTTQDER